MRCGSHPAARAGHSRPERLEKADGKRREALYDIITGQALAYGIAFASEQEIDEINILQATFLAMRRAMDQLRVRPDIALIDGNRETDFGLPVQTIVKGDSLSANIAAASILAKVTRDRFMLKWMKNIRSTALPRTRATVRARTMPRCANSVRAPSIAVPS